MKKSKKPALQFLENLPKRCDTVALFRYFLFPRDFEFCQESLTKTPQKIYKYNVIIHYIMAQQKTGLESQDKLDALHAELQATPPTEKSKISQIIRMALLAVGIFAFVPPAMAEKAQNFKLNADGSFDLILADGKTYDCKKEILAVIKEANHRNKKIINPFKKMIRIKPANVNEEVGDCKWHNRLAQQEYRIAKLDEKLAQFAQELAVIYGEEGWYVTEQETERGLRLVIKNKKDQIMGESVRRGNEWHWDLRGLKAESQKRIDAMWQRVLEDAIANSGKRGKS